MQGYRGAAVGKGRQLAKTELEKLKFSELSMREAVMEAARMYVHPFSRSRGNIFIFDVLASSLSMTTRRKRTLNSRCPGLVMRRMGFTSRYPKISSTRHQGRQRRRWRTSSNVWHTFIVIYADTITGRHFSLCTRQVICLVTVGPPRA